MSPSKTEPSVCCVMLTANRPAMAKQAVECFRAQTYNSEQRILFVCDTGNDTKWSADLYGKENEGFFDATPHKGKSIGELRNLAMRCFESEIVIHWDDDDFSHPNRIAEQVALLQSSGADCVGYNECLFWREPVHSVEFPARQPGGRTCVRNIPGEAWLYRNPDPHYALGTSLCYWRKTWERKLFEATSQGEDLRWIAGLKVAAVSGIDWADSRFAQYSTVDKHVPRMIARIHSGNTSTAYKPEAMQREAQKRDGMWKRVPEWDSYCAGVFA